MSRDSSISPAPQLVFPAESRAAPRATPFRGTQMLVGRGSSGVFVRARLNQVKIKVCNNVKNLHRNNQKWANYNNKYTLIM